MALNPGLDSIRILCVHLTRLYNLVAKTTRHVKGHFDGTAVYCDRSRQEADFNRNVRSRGAVVVGDRNLR